MRKDVIKSYTIFNAEDASAPFDNKDNPTEITNMDNIGVTVLWTGAPVGEFKVFVSNDNADYVASKPVQSWYELDFGSPILINALDTHHVININQCSFRWIAFGYESVSGTGTLTSVMQARMV